MWFVEGGLILSCVNFFSVDKLKEKRVIIGIFFRLYRYDTYRAIDIGVDWLGYALYFRISNGRKTIING